MGFIYFCFFGISFLGVTFTLVTIVKPDYPFDEDKVDVTEAVSLFFCAIIILLELVNLIQKSCGVSVFIFLINQIFIKRQNKRCIKLCVLIFNIIFKQFFI